MCVPQSPTPSHHQLRHHYFLSNYRILHQSHIIRFGVLKLGDDLNALLLIDKPKCTRSMLCNIDWFTLFVIFRKAVFGNLKIMWSCSFTSMVFTITNSKQQIEQRKMLVVDNRLNKQQRRTALNWIIICFAFNTKLKPWKICHL